MVLCLQQNQSLLINKKTIKYKIKLKRDENQKQKKEKEKYNKHLAEGSIFYMELKDSK